DGGRTDAPVTNDGSMRDGPYPRDTGNPGDGSACPAGAPMDGEVCTGSEICTYGDIGCACVRATQGGPNRREWQCRRIADAARDPDCPTTPPAGGLSCADAGAGTVCRYPGNVFCACDQQDQWRCT